MVREISLANKCQLLFGAAILLIIAAALTLPWLLVRSIVDRNSLDTARQVALLWPRVEAAPFSPEAASGLAGRPRNQGDDGEHALEVFYAPAEQFPRMARGDGFASTVASRLLEQGAESGAMDESLTIGPRRVYRYARPITDDKGDLAGVVLVEHRSPHASGQLLLNRAYLLAAGLLAGALAVLVFYLITTRLILKPVRELRDTAELVREGDLGIRSDIRTGDEFEQLSDAFNDMLEELQINHQQLQASKHSLDLKVSELEQRNIDLHQAASIKNDFIASVSHELRTPLNSIIGFAELLEEIAEREHPSPDNARELADYEKRRRYLRHIVDAGRSLLEMIVELLDMAKIEAGKMDLHVEPMSVPSACQGLVALIRPQAERKRITLSVDLRPEDDADASVGIIETDPRKFQQVVFNFLSNAVKFTPEQGSVTLRAERIVAGDGEPRMRVSVLDSGPGIAPEDQSRIFDKFTRLESGHAREHAGTGLGLAIAKELANMIQGEIQIVSEIGQGSMLSLIVPLKMDPDRAARMQLLTAGRGSGATLEAIDAPSQDQVAAEPAENDRPQPAGRPHEDDAAR